MICRTCCVLTVTMCLKSLDRIYRTRNSHSWAARERKVRALCSAVASSSRNLTDWIFIAIPNISFGNFIKRKQGLHHRPPLNPDDTVVRHMKLSYSEGSQTSGSFSTSKRASWDDSDVLLGVYWKPTRWSILGRRRLVYSQETPENASVNSLPLILRRMDGRKSYRSEVWQRQFIR